MILETVSNFESYKKCRKRLGLDDIITYGAGMVMLFYGPPGTGKTMMANALANKLNKKVHCIHNHSKFCTSLLIHCTIVREIFVGKIFVLKYFHGLGVTTILYNVLLFLVKYISCDKFSWFEPTTKIF